MTKTGAEGELKQTVRERYARAAKGDGCCEAPAAWA